MKTLAKTAVQALCAVALGGAAVSPALAEQFEHKTVSVSYADLDLGTAAGQKALDKRVERAVRSACRVTRLDTGTRMMSTDAEICLAKARADAKRQVAEITNNAQRGG